MEAFPGCNLVLANPDNVLYPDHRFSAGEQANAKRIPLAEAERLAEGRTAVLYHRFRRSSPDRSGWIWPNSPAVPAPAAGGPGYGPRSSW